MCSSTLYARLLLNDPHHLRTRTTQPLLPPVTVYVRPRVSPCASLSTQTSTLRRELTSAIDAQASLRESADNAEARFRSALDSAAALEAADKSSRKDLATLRRLLQQKDGTIESLRTRVASLEETAKEKATAAAAVQAKARADRDRLEGEVS